MLSVLSPNKVLSLTKQNKCSESAVVMKLRKIEIQVSEIFDYCIPLLV